MSEQVKLLACPFCADSNVRCITMAHWNGPDYYAHCPDCGASTKFFESEAAVFAAWNTRLPDRYTEGVTAGLEMAAKECDEQADNRSSIVRQISDRREKELEAAALKGLREAAGLIRHPHPRPASRERQQQGGWGVKKMKPVKAWAGPTGASCLDWRYEFGSAGAITVYAVYRTKREAKRQCRDVRRVEIREIKR